MVQCRNTSPRCQPALSVCGKRLVNQTRFLRRPVTSLWHQEGRRVYREGPKFFELCPTHFSRGGIFLGRASPSLRPPWLQVCFYGFTFYFCQTRFPSQLRNFFIAANLVFAEALLAMIKLVSSGFFYFAEMFGVGCSQRKCSNSFCLVYDNAFQYTVSFLTSTFSYKFTENIYTLIRS